MRIGEVAIISYNAQEKEDFIGSVCQKFEINSDSICFGCFEVNDQLALYLYGFSFDNKDKLLSWDLVSRKTLGFIIIFDWEDKKKFEAIKPIIDYFSCNFNTPIIIIANIKDKKDPPIPYQFFQPDGILLSSNSRFIFSQVKDPESARKALILLINMLIERLS